MASANVKRSRRRSLGAPSRSLQPGNRPGNTKFVRELYVYVQRVAVTLPSTSGIEARQLLPPWEKRRAPGATQRKEYFIMRGNSSSLEAVASSRWLDYRRRRQRELQENSVTPSGSLLDFCRAYNSRDVTRGRLSAQENVPHCQVVAHQSVFLSAFYRLILSIRILVHL